MKRKKLPELLSLAEASEILKAHPNSLRKWDREGILKAVRFGKRGDRRYRREDLEKFINTRMKDQNDK